MKRIVSICSARPNFVKLAAIHHALREEGAEEIEHILVHTGQHYDPLFSDIFFQQLSIPVPHHNLGIHGGTREEVIERTEQAFGALLAELNPSTLLVYGDVNGAVGPARIAHREGIRVAHVEAGLRSFDNEMPEELNRIAIDEVADMLLCSEQSGVENLQREGARGFIHLVGNTMIDTLLRMMPLIESEPMPVEADEPFAVVTLHRPSNVDSPEALRRNVEFLAELSERIPLILPAHHRLKAALERFDLASLLPPRVRVLPPLGYIPFLRLTKEAAFLLTDSGGIQEEAVLLGKRCFTLRKNTERPSTIESGSNVLIDLEHAQHREAVLSFAVSPETSAITVPPLWDGKAGSRIVSLLRA